MLSFSLSIAGLVCCRRPTSLHDRGRDSDDDDFRDRDYDVAALANNLSQAFRYGIYSNDDIEEVCQCASFVRFDGLLLSKYLSLHLATVSTAVLYMQTY